MTVLLLGGIPVKICSSSARLRVGSFYSFEAPFPINFYIIVKMSEIVLKTITPKAYEPVR